MGLGDIKMCVIDNIVYNECKEEMTYALRSSSEKEEMWLNHLLAWGYCLASGAVFTSAKAVASAELASYL